MKRGDVVLVVVQGDYGKPRPAIIAQTNLLNPTHNSIVVCLITSECCDAPLYRITVQPRATNGLKIESQIMIDKIVALPAKRIKKRIGKLTEKELLALDKSLGFVLGLAG